jgi:hypothetical protein
MSNAHVEYFDYADTQQGAMMETLDWIGIPYEVRPFEQRCNPYELMTDLRIGHTSLVFNKHGRFIKVV